MQHQRKICFTLGLIPCLFASSAWAQTKVSFNAPPRDYAVPSTPNAAVVGDFNGDGKLDIAAIGDLGISVLPGIGNGGFGRAIYTSLEVGTYGALVAEDFNHDGILDLASYGLVPDGVVVFLGKGNGTFLQQPVIYLNGVSLTLVAADLNNDGNVDLVTAADSRISILLGKGDGTFEPSFAIDIYSPQYVQAGDFNGDGKIDLAVSSGNSPNFVVLIGNGDGTFRGSGTSYSISSFTGNFAIGDVNNDGKLDVVATGASTAILLGNGDGTLQAPTYIAGGSSSGPIVLADFNLDGNPDFATITKLSTVTIWLGNGAGGFTKSSNATLGNSPTTLSVGDFNGDGRPDLATAEAATELASVLLTGAGGRIEQAASYNSGVPEEPVAAIVADVNNDGKPDVIAVSDDANVSVLLGTGNSSAPLQTAMNILLPGAAAVAVAAADLNGDGKLDLLVADQFNGLVIVLLGHGDGTFTNGVTLAAGSQPGSIATGDFNGDGIVDFAVGDEYSSSVLVFIGNGDGTFQPSATYTVPNYATNVVAGDFNGDGHTDLVVAEGGQTTIPGGASILIANPNGTFQPAATIYSGTLLYQAVVGDVNGDGKLDVLFNNDGGGFYEFLGNGDGTFQPFNVVSGNPTSLDLSLVDLAGDGNLDLVSAGYASNAFSILLGAGNGAFSREFVYGASLSPRVVVAADFSGNGKPDLISLQVDNFNGPSGATVTSSTYTVLLNTTP